MKKLGSKVLVTGAAGFIGSHLSDRLRSLGLGVVGLDDFSNGHMENLLNLRKDSGFELIRGSILNAKDVSKACKGVDSMFHMAAQSSVAKSTEDPIHDFELNTVGTLNLLECARKTGVKTMIFVSSSTVYGEAKVPTPEDHPLGPVSNYGASKAASEAYCHSYSSLYGIHAASLRYYNVYGPRSRKGVMFDFLEKLRKDSSRLEVLGTGEQLKDYIYIDDVVDATLLVAAKGKLAGEAYNVGSGESYSVKKLIDKLLRILGLNGETKPFYRGGFSWLGDVQRTQADISRLKKLGFRPKIGFDKGLKLFVEWYEKEHGDIADTTCSNLR